jgi:two-component system chemotaxis response regulator CheB
MSVEKLIIIGSSAGGPRILKDLFHELPRLKASVIVVQHMPKFINESIRDMIGEQTQMDVQIARHGDILKEGIVYIAPSERHLRLIDNRKIELQDGEKINYVCPSIDMTMQSVQNTTGQSLMGVILTGMGHDGAEGIQHIKKIGGVTIAQNEETSVIFGMPKEAIATGAVDWVLDPIHIRNKIIGTTNLLKSK